MSPAISDRCCSSRFCDRVSQLFFHYFLIFIAIQSIIISKKNEIELPIITIQSCPIHSHIHKSTIQYTYFPQEKSSIPLLQSLLQLQKYLHYFSFYNQYLKLDFQKTMARRLNLKDKMQEINQKFTLKTKTNITNDVLENKLINLKKKIGTFAVKNQQQMSQMKTQAIQLLDRLEKNNLAYENQAQMQLRELQQLSIQLNTRIENEVTLRKEKENQLVQTMQKKLKSLKSQIQKEKKERTEVMEQITNTLKNDVPTLMNEVIDSAKAREEEEQKLAEIIEGEITECDNQAKQFKEKQQENCAKIYALIRDLTLKAKKQVQQEKAIRQQTHDEILSYIEQTCNKIGD